MSSTATRPWVRRMGITMLATIMSTLSLALPIAGPAQATSAFSFQRLAGTDRYDTARIISTTSFATADTAVLATGENFPDALAGNFLAGNLNAPILLVQRGAVPAATSSALQTLKTKNIFLVGGVNAISQQVQDQLAGTDSTAAAGGKLNVTRIAGANRYETSRLIASASGTTVGATGGKKTAIISSGGNFPDALAAGPLSWALKFPTILTDPATLSPEARQALTDLGIQQVLITGGTNAVSSAVEQAINGMGITTLQRFAGTDRSDTSRLVAEYAIANFGFKNSHFNVASGDQRFGGSDALVLGPHGGKEDPTANLVTNTSDGPGKVVDFAAAHEPTLTSGHAAGGVVPLTDGALGQISAAAGSGAPSGFLFTPSGRTVKTVGSGLNDAAAQITFTVSNTGADPLRIALFACDGVDAPHGSGTAVTFTAPIVPPATTPTAGPAVGEGVTNAGAGSGAKVVGANGAPTTPAKAVGPVNPVGTGISFVVGTDAPDCFIPVVYRDTNGNGKLDVAASGAPTETAAAGGRTTYNPPNAAPGTVPSGANPGAVTSVGKEDSFFVLDNNATYTYKDGDTFQILQGTPLPGTCTAVSKQVFVDALSVDDKVTGTYSTSAASTFCLQDLGPVAPASVTPAASPGFVDVAFPDSVTRSVVSYKVYRKVKPAAPQDCSAGALSTYTLLGTVADDSPNVGSGAAHTFRDFSIAEGTTYCYAVTSVDAGGQEGQPRLGPAAGVTTPLAAPPISTQASFTSSAPPSTILASGDTLSVTFDRPVTLAATVSLSIADDDGTIGTLTTGSNMTANMSSNTVTFTLTGAPAITKVGTTAGLALSSLEVLTETGIGNAAGPWNLPASGLTTPQHSRTFNVAANTSLPTGPTAASATQPNQVTATCSDATDQLRVYTVAGVQIGSAACTGGAQTLSTSSSFATGATLFVTEVGQTAGRSQESKTTQVTAA